jgi:hypothetical protein
LTHLRQNKQNAARSPDEIRRFGLEDCPMVHLDKSGFTDGFYEWKKLDAKGKLKQPHAMAMARDAQMVMAGLWAKWKSPTNQPPKSLSRSRQLTFLSGSHEH